MYKIPKGYVLVPIEPTLEMVIAGELAWEEQIDLRLSARFNNEPFAIYPSEETHKLCARVAYEAMIKAVETIS